MRVTIPFPLPVLAIIALLVSATFALAQGTEVRVSDLVAPWAEMLVGAMAILLTAIIGWAAAQLKARTGIDIEAHHREALQTALTNAAGLALMKFGGSLADKKLDLRHPLIKDGILYVNNAVPDAVRKFGLTPEQLAEKLVAKLGLVTMPELTTSEFT